MPASSSIPPALPPSVEEAYRRKCIQLKQRTSEVEEANDAARVRLTRLKRQVEKMRLERAFLLEQLAKRTSTNVEDSDGSASPPPTQAKEQPLRVKRGHRKPSLLAHNEAPTSANATFISQNPQALSPSSEAFSAQLPQVHQVQPSAAKPNGAAATDSKGAGSRSLPKPQRPSSAFELFCVQARADLDDRAKDGRQGLGSEAELARIWKEELAEDQRAGYEAKRDQELAKYEKAKGDYNVALSEEAALAAKGGDDVVEGAAVKQEKGGPAAAPGRDNTARATQDGDVEMTNYDTDQETQADRAED